MSIQQYIYIYIYIYIKYKQKTKKNSTTGATMPSGIVATVQNLNKRVEKKRKKEKGLMKPLLQLQCYTVKYVGCTVPKYCSGIAAFYIY